MHSDLVQFETFILDKPAGTKRRYAAGLDSNHDSKRFTLANGYAQSVHHIGQL